MVTMIVKIIQTRLTVVGLTEKQEKYLTERTSSNTSRWLFSWMYKPAVFWEVKNGPI